MIEITREQANEIIADHWNKPRQKVVICYGGKWYDIRNSTEAEIQEFITKLINIKN